MTKYYRLLPDYKTLKVDIQTRDDPEGEINDDLDMKNGTLLSITPKTPLLFDFEIEGYENNRNVKWDFPDYDTKGPTMNVALLKTIEGVGVDNVESFPVVLVNTHTGEEYHDRHTAVNVVGLVSCANIDTSVSQPLADTYYFHELKIDEKKTMGLLIFRLAEQPSDIIVHEKIAEAILKGNFKGLILEEVS